nr:MAG TPA: hypothetical protein [Caudoviricetes sp.]
MSAQIDAIRHTSLEYHYRYSSVFFMTPIYQRYSI